MADGPGGAIRQRDKETYAIVPKIPVGLITPAILENISRVARKYEIPILKIVSGQRLALVGMKAEQLEEIWRELELKPGKATELCVHYVQACPGNVVCKLGVQDSLGMGLALDKLFAGLELPGKVKIGVSGCPMTCGESFVRDIGVQGRKNGWTFIFGGNSGGHPRIGDILAEDLTSDQVFELTKKALEYYQANGKKRERTARLVERMGLEALKKALGLI